MTKKIEIDSLTKAAMEQILNGLPLTTNNTAMGQELMYHHIIALAGNLQEKAIAALEELTGNSYISPEVSKAIKEMQDNNAAAEAKLLVKTPKKTD